MIYHVKDCIYIAWQSQAQVYNNFHLWTQLDCSAGVELMFAGVGGLVQLPVIGALKFH